jgi:formamidopyrimidine-DNA glycosylase
MPEVVEVMAYADLLRTKLKGKSILEINILKGRYAKHGSFDEKKDLLKNLPIKVIDVRSKGKLIYISLEKDFYLLSTLGLSGGWVAYENKLKSYKLPKLIGSYKDYNEYSDINSHLNVEFKIKGGSVYFFDMLSFGTLKVIKDKTELDKKLSQLGPDIMNLTTTLEIFSNKIMSKPKQKIGILLLNQKIISGIGNYLRADVLWLSKVSPFRKVKDLTMTEIKDIYHNVRLLTWGVYNKKKAIKLKIISSRDKLPSAYDRDFFIYDQTSDIYDNPVKKEELYESSQKRFIYWVPKVQK